MEDVSASSDVWTRALRSYDQPLPLPHADESVRHACEDLARLVREIAGLDVTARDVEIVRGRYLLQSEDMTFALALPPLGSGYVPELEFLSFRCRLCGRWFYVAHQGHTGIVHSLSDVGRILVAHVNADQDRSA